MDQVKGNGNIKKRRPQRGEARKQYFYRSVEIRHSGLSTNAMDLVTLRRQWLGRHAPGGSGGCAGHSAHSIVIPRCRRRAEVRPRGSSQVQRGSRIAQFRGLAAEIGLKYITLSHDTSTVADAPGGAFGCLPVSPSRRRETCRPALRRSWIILAFTGEVKYPEVR